MLKLYDNLQNIIEQSENQEWRFEPYLPYFASEIMESLNIEDDDEIQLSLKRTFEACNILHIPIKSNFKKIFRFDGKNLITDWKVSALAHYLIIINCNPSNELVAKAQLYFVMHRSEQK